MAKTAPIAYENKTILDAQIIVYYKGNEIASTPPVAVTLMALSIAFDPIQDFTGVSGSVKENYINMRFKSDAGTTSMTDFEIETHLSPSDEKLNTYSFAKGADTWPLKGYSLTLPVVTVNKTETIYFVVFGKYVDFDGKTKTIELNKTSVVTITTTKV